MDSILVEKYIGFVKELALIYQYDTNITHLLYLIIPAFISKYSLTKERLILSIFRQTRIIVSSNKDQVIHAYYTSIPSYKDNKIITTKYIVIQNYENISLVQLLDNLVHEFNHAVNSYQKEIVIKEDTLFLRTGLTYASYSLLDLKPLKKEVSYVLEEILNTNQTKDIINIIKGCSTINEGINNTIEAINRETDTNYVSKSYYLETMLFKRILENKTFISTLNILRLSGDVEEIESWFDNIIGWRDSYKKMNYYLKEISDLEKELGRAHFFKKRIIKKIKGNINKILEIIEAFNQNCNYK